MPCDIDFVSTDAFLSLSFPINFDQFYNGLPFPSMNDLISLQSHGSLKDAFDSPNCMLYIILYLERDNVCHSLVLQPISILFPDVI